MAKSKLNVQLGLDITAFERAILRASNKMEQFGKRMESIGSDLTARLSLPLAGVGAAALSAFADFERLDKGLQAVMGSAEAADAEMARLQESAKLPGLGFQEAVKGSIRLQAVGLSADEARTTLEAFGAAIAATGGSAQNLDSVQYQLTQMISKNRILQEDFGILQENVPLLGKAVQNAFGTANIEKIRATGISAEEFNRRIVAALQALPEVQKATGGLGNAFDNFTDSLNFSLVALGETINETLNLEGILNAVSGAVQGLVNLFQSLSPTTQKVIVVIAAVAAAIGPLLFAIGAVTKIVPLLVAGFTALKGAAIALATPLTLKVVVFTAIAYIIGFLYKRFETFRRVVNGLGKAFVTLASFAKNAFVALLDGFNKLKSGDFSGAAESFKKGLQLFNPIEFGKQFIEGFAKGFEDNTDYIDKGIENLKARVQGTLNDFKPKITPEITAPETGGGGGGGGEGRKVPILLQPNAQQQQKVFDQIEQDALARFRKPKAVLQPFEFEGKDPVKETEIVLGEYGKAIADADAKARIFGTDTQTLLQEKFAITSSFISEGVEKFGENSLIIETLTGQYNGLAASLDAVAERQALIAKYQEVVGKVFELAASRINESGLSIKTILGSVVDAVRSAVVEFVRLKIVEAVASFIADSFKKFGILGVALGAAAGAVVGGVFTGAINAIAPPRLARGGLATKETLAVVGDNPSGKEAIIPFERMGEFLDMAGGGAMRLVGQFEVRGQDLILVLDRATQQKLRVR
jgi:tape measure domain-containing protein